MHCIDFVTGLIAVSCLLSSPDPKKNYCTASHRQWNASFGGVYPNCQAGAPTKHGVLPREVSAREWVICKPELSRKLQNHQSLARHFDRAIADAIV